MKIGQVDTEALKMLQFLFAVTSQCASFEIVAFK